MIATLVGQGYRPKQCCRILGVASGGYFRWKLGPISQAELRRQWLRQAIRQAHSASRGTYGYRRVRAELRLGLGIAISRKTVQKLMGEEGLAGLPVRKYRKNLVNVATFEDLVQRKFRRDAPNQLWVTDITEHPTKEGKVYCCVVLDAHSRRVVGWSIDTHQASSLVTNALSMALTNRATTTGTVIHSDHGTQFTSWSFTERVRQARLVPSMGTIRRRLRQRSHRVILGPVADRTAQPAEVAHPNRAVHRALRIPGDLPQPQPKAQLPRNAHTRRLREPPSGVRHCCLTLI